MHVVVVGGGFAGVKAALELSKRQVGTITLISDQPYFLHHATLYATATGKNDAESVIPLETIFADHPNVKIVLDKIEHLDPSRRIVNGKIKSYHYDKLILALGSVTTFFNLDGVGKHAYGIKSLNEVHRFQEHMHEEIVQKKLDKDYFVIGAGPTGVELAAALNQYLKNLKHLYRLKNTHSRVTLVEAAPRVVPTLSITASRLVSRQLKKQGIRVLANHAVQRLTGNEIVIQGKAYPTTTAIWTSGVATSPFFDRNRELFVRAKNGRVVVNPFLEALDHVYVIGDNSSADPYHMAWPAIRQATHAARNIVRLATNQAQKPYRSRRSVVSLPVGDSWGYVEKYGLYVDGRLGAWYRRRIELKGYLQLMPKKVALPIWRAHHLDEVDYS